MIKQEKRGLKIFASILLEVLVIAVALTSDCQAASVVESNPESYTVDTTVISGMPDVYHLGNEAICGTTEDRNKSIDFEGVAGLKIKTSGAVVTFTAYTHNTGYLEGGDVFIWRGISKKTDKIKVGHVRNEESGFFDIEEKIKANSIPKPIGLYTICLALSDQDCYGHLYWDGKNVRTCRIGSNMKFKIEGWSKAVAQIDPNRCLDFWVGNKNNPITYPTSGKGSDCNHVQLWRDLAHEIIQFDTWSDETKVFAFANWLAGNCAFDEWRYYENGGKSRAATYNKWNDDSLFMFYNHVGTSWDFVNAMTIMCREYGIPCTSVDNSAGYTANAVWLDGEWVCVDVCALTHYSCVEEDVDPEKWIIKTYYSSYMSDYGVYRALFTTHNQGLCTPITATSYEPNPL